MQTLWLTDIRWSLCFLTWSSFWLKLSKRQNKPRPECTTKSLMKWFSTCISIQRRASSQQWDLGNPSLAHTYTMTGIIGIKFQPVALMEDGEAGLVWQNKNNHLSFWYFIYWIIASRWYSTFLSKSPYLGFKPTLLKGNQDQHVPPDPKTCPPFLFPILAHVHSLFLSLYSSLALPSKSKSCVAIATAAVCKNSFF